MSLLPTLWINGIDDIVQSISDQAGVYMEYPQFAIENKDVFEFWFHVIKINHFAGLSQSLRYVFPEFE